MNWKVKVGMFLVITVMVLGIVGIILEAADNLPPELQMPWFSNVSVIIGLLLTTLGLRDEFDEGKTSLIELIRNFFVSDPYRKLGLTVLLTVARSIVAAPQTLPPVWTTAAQAVLALAAVFSFTAFQAHRKARLITRGKI